MGKSTNSAVAARARTRDRRVAAGVDTVARQARIGDAAADAHAAIAAIESAREQAALAIAAARAHERNEVAGAQTIIESSVRRLSGERLTVAQVAELVGMPAPDVRRILRSTPMTDDNLTGGAAATAQQ